MTTASRPRLIVIDVPSLLHRAYHAVPQHFATAAGEPTNAIYGFTNMLLSIVDNLKPQHAATAFDLPGKTFRHHRYAEYKAHRAELDDALAVQFGRVREVIAAFGIPIYELEGYEADDLLGSLARQGEAAGLEVYLVTGDRDAFQLVTPHVRVLSSNPRTSEPVVYDAAAVQARWGVRPDQVVDFKGLMGDSSDNIPGVPGIGEKTAARLLGQYPDIDSIYAHLDDLKPAARKKLESQHELALLSRELARIVTDLPVDLDLRRTRLWQPDAAVLDGLLEELQFRGVRDRLPFREAPKAQPPAWTQETGEVRIVDTAVEAEALAETLTSTKRAGLHPITRATPSGPELLGIGLAWDDEAVYLACDGDGAEQLRPLGEWLTQDAPTKVAFDSKWLYRALASRGLRLHGVTADLLLAAYLADPNATPKSLDDLAFRRKGWKLEPQAPELSTDMLTAMDGLLAARAAAVRAAAALSLSDDLAEELAEKGLTDLLHDVEIPLAPVLAEMEIGGVRLDVGALRQLSSAMDEQIRRLETEIYADVGHEFNIGSPKQLGAILFEELSLPAGRRTKTGYSTASQVLEELVDTHPVVRRVLDYRAVTKLRSTYVDALPELINPATGRLHTTFGQAVAATGRLSSANPNLQNIPIRTEQGREIRRAFVAGGDDRLLLAVDYSQIELRVLAHISADKAMCAAFHAGQDIHDATAALIHQTPAADVTPEMRRLAKIINFGIVYGISAQGLAQRTELRQREAAEFIQSYFATYPEVKGYMDRTIAEAHERGYVQTLLGRRRYLPGLKARAFHERTASERMAINMPVQGSAADIIKIAMIELARELERRELGTRLLLQVHDELVFDVPENEMDEVVPLAKEVMGSAARLKVPLAVDAKAGANWRDMTEI